MMKFTKRYLPLIAAVIAGSWAVSAPATTLVRPYGSSDYAGGQRAVGSKVNSEFDTIVNWLNGANIDSTNIYAGGIATSNYAAGSVTLAKLAASTLTVTATSSDYQTTGSVTPATVTNLSTTFTSTGRPILVSLEANPATYLSGGVPFFGSFVRQYSNPSGTSDALFFVRDSTTTAYFFLSNITGAATITDKRSDCGSFHYTEYNLPAGTYSFAVKVGLAATTNTVFVTNCRLVVREVL